MEYSLSGNDILENVDCNLIKLSEIKNYNSIDALLKNNRCVILFENRMNVGHWTCMYKRGNTIFFFDSYGNDMKGVYDFVPKNINQSLQQNFKDLVKLLYNSPYKVEYNDYELQKDADGINTCGRWCIIRMEYPQLSLDQFNKLFKNKALSPDEIIVKLTPEFPKTKGGADAAAAAAADPLDAPLPPTPISIEGLTKRIDDVEKIEARLRGMFGTPDGRTSELTHFCRFAAKILKDLYVVISNILEEIEKIKFDKRKVLTMINTYYTPYYDILNRLWQFITTPTNVFAIQCYTSPNGYFQHRRAWVITRLIGDAPHALKARYNV
tara:strand:- start:385 stop:1356 length:972 start_codon:yes stop_codon:yes gene_type:complete